MAVRHDMPRDKLMHETHCIRPAGMCRISASPCQAPRNAHCRTAVDSSASIRQKQVFYCWWDKSERRHLLVAASGKRQGYEGQKPPQNEQHVQQLEGQPRGKEVHHKDGGGCLPKGGLGEALVLARPLQMPLNKLKENTTECQRS